jgi:exo-beta-1,3-glucanase (GH17 family)
MAVFMPMIFCDKISTLVQYTRTSATNAGCISFTALTPSISSGQNCGDVSINSAHVDTLLDRILTQTPFRCLQMYGLSEQAIAQAKAKGFKVIVVLFLDVNANNNLNVINQAVSVGTNPLYSDTIIGWSCGNEMRNGNNQAVVEPAIKDCIQRLRNGGAPQAITSNNQYYAWCNEETAAPYCSKWSTLSWDVDYIGTNIYPYWNNKFIPNQPGNCVTASQAAQKTLDDYLLTQGTYPERLVIVTEWGWPAGVNGFYHSDCNPSQAGNPNLFGVASETNQNLVVQQTLNLFRSQNVGVPSVLFAGHREPCKANPMYQEPEEGPYWGVCSNVSPYNCKPNIY